MATAPALTVPVRDSAARAAGAGSATAVHLAHILQLRVDRIDRHAARDDASAYDDGRELVAIEQGRLWRHGGYRGMNDFLQRGLRRLAASTARQRWEVARHLPRDFVAQHGLLKCYFGLRMVALEGIAASPAALEHLEVEAERGGQMMLLPFEAASTNEVRRAAARRRPAADPLRGLTAEWRQRLRPIARALRPFETVGGPAAISISARGRAPERALVRIAVPLDQLGVLYRALGEVLGVPASPGHAAGRAPTVTARRRAMTPPLQPVRRTVGRIFAASPRTRTRTLSRVPRASARPVARARPEAKEHGNVSRRPAARVAAAPRRDAVASRKAGRTTNPPALATSPDGRLASARARIVPGRRASKQRRKPGKMPP
jgi:hypothetical protein